MNANLTVIIYEVERVYNRNAVLHILSSRCQVMLAAPSVSNYKSFYLFGSFILLCMYLDILLYLDV